MPKMRAVEFLEKTAEIKKKYRVLLLTGDDILLKEIILEAYGRDTDLFTELERYSILDGRNIEGEWSEGSLLGVRLIAVYVPGKIKNFAALERALKHQKDVEDLLVIIPDLSWKEVDTNRIKDLLLEVICKNPRTKKDKQRLVKVRAKMHGVNLREDIAKMVVERMESTMDLETMVSLLCLLLKSGEQIKLTDVPAIIGEPPKLRDMTRAILKGNTTRLAREILEGDPLPTIGAGHALMLKLFTWLECNEEDEGIVERLGLSKRFIKDWRLARLHYAPQTIRKVMEVWEKVYRDIRRGRKQDWKERLRLSIRDLNPRK